MSAPRTLVLAWGNPGRGDDGLGPAFAELVADEAGFGLTVDSTYQLQVEDAAEIAQHDRVVFVDADRGGPPPFRMSRLEPAAGPPAFSTHSVAPGELLALARGLFGSAPEAWLLGIRGYQFDEFGEELSAPARANLAAAASFVREALRDGVFLESPPPAPVAVGAGASSVREVDHV